MNSKELEQRDAMREMLQRKLDAQKTAKERNILGQFATPLPLATDIMSRAKSLMPDRTVSLIEPSIGLGTFYAAFRQVFRNQAGHTLGFEIDPAFHKAAQDIWSGEDIDLRCSDFLAAEQQEEFFDLLVANPPYVRHHHINREKKKQLQKEMARHTGIQISGLAGLYCYFLILSGKWLKRGGLSCWLIPTEFMDVGYGAAVKRYLLENVDLIAIHRFEAADTQFSDALVSSTVVFFRNSSPSNREFVFSSGPSMNNPATSIAVSRDSLLASSKWSSLFKGLGQVSERAECRLGNFFSVKRGIATGSNKFFIISSETAKRYSIPSQFLRPILPSPRYLRKDIVLPDKAGNISLPKEEYLFSCSLPEDILKEKYPTVWEYVQEGKRQGIDKGYICSHRTIWYSCENRQPAPFVVPYMGRGDASTRIFRFILNQSNAITTNVYLLLYPKEEYARFLQDPNTANDVWVALNRVNTEQLICNGREYGGGLHKLEPNELLEIMIPDVASILNSKRMASEPTLF